MENKIKSRIWLPSGEICTIDLDPDYYFLPNFQVKELANNLAKDEIKFEVPGPQSWIFLRMLQCSRDHFGRIDLTSGYRTQSFNNAQKGATKDSLHCYMLAADVLLGNRTYDAWARWWKSLCQTFGQVGAIGFYHNPDRLHIEIGSDWRYGAKNFEIRDHR